MPFPLHKSPAGLLEIFRLRTLGANPPQFGEQVTPVTDVTEFYAADTKLISGAAGVAGALTGAGIASTLTLTGKVRVHVASARLVVGAAAATNVTLVVELIDTTNTLVLCSEFLAAVNAAAIAGSTFVSSRPFVLPAGNNMRFRARASGTAAGVDHSIQIMLLTDNMSGTI